MFKLVFEETALEAGDKLCGGRHDWGLGGI